MAGHQTFHNLIRKYLLICQKWFFHIFFYSQTTSLELWREVLNSIELSNTPVQENKIIYFTKIFYIETITDGKNISSVELRLF